MESIGVIYNPFTNLLLTSWDSLLCVGIAIPFRFDKVIIDSSGCFECWLLHSPVTYIVVALVTCYVNDIVLLQLDDEPNL